MSIWALFLLSSIACGEAAKLKCIKSKYLLVGSDMALVKKDQILKKLVPRGRANTLVHLETPECVAHGERWVGTEAKICSTDSEIAIEAIDEVSVFRTGISISDAFLEVYSLCI